MVAWWASIDTITSLNVATRWAAGICAILAALFGLVALVSGLRLDALKATRQNALEAQQKDRRLTGDQKAAIKSALVASPKGRITVISMVDSIESYRYASDFSEVLLEAGWEVRTQPIMRFSEGEPPTGVILAMENPQAIPTWVNPLFKAIESAGVKIEAQTAPQLVDNSPISLVIAYKP